MTLVAKAAESQVQGAGWGPALKAKTRGVQWGGLLEECWFLLQVSHPSLHHKTVSILYGTELEGEECGD